MYCGLYTPKRVCGSVVRVTEPDPKALDEPFNRALHTEDERVDRGTGGGHCRRHARDRGVCPTRQAAVLLASAMRATRVLEIGTLAGYSTIQLARAVGPGGRVVTLEYEPKHAEVARESLARAGVDDRVEVIVGAALDTLPPWPTVRSRST